MAILRRHPYIWATWLARTMSGTAVCQWQYWFQAHYRLEEKQPTTLDTAAWQVRHTRLLTDLRRDLARQGVKTWAEHGFAVPVPAHGAVVAGRIDCVAFQDPDVVAYDCKTVGRQDAHVAQLLIYMHALASDDRFAGRDVRGVLVYLDGRQEISQVPEGIADDIDYFVGLLAGDEEPPRDPGAGCRFCSATARDCLARAEG